MEFELLKSIAQQGPWAAAFVGLLIYIMRENAKREERLMKFTEEITPALQALTDEVHTNTSVIADTRRVVLDCETNHDRRTNPAKARP